MSDFVYFILGLLGTLVKNKFIRYFIIGASFLLILYLSNKIYRIRNWRKTKKELWLLVTLIIAFFAAWFSPINEVHQIDERGVYTLDLYSIKPNLVPIDENNRPEINNCKSAILRNIDTDVEYNNWSQIGRDLTFQNILIGKYQLTINIDGYEEFKCNLDVGAKELVTKNLESPKKTYRYLLIENPEWGDWGEWGEWQDEKIEGDILTEVETKIINVESEKTGWYRSISTPNRNKPIFGEKDVQVGYNVKNVCREVTIDEERNAQVCSNWEEVQEPVFATIPVIVNYERDLTKYDILDYSKTKIEYRYRTRNLISEISDTIYATDDSQDYLETLGYEKIIDRNN